jgi:hypothetical protein
MAFNVFDESPENEIVLKEQQAEQQARQQANKVFPKGVNLILDACGILSII